jgi:hypothetical protein
MPPLHPKVKPEHLHEDGLLLSEEERALVGRIQEKVQLFQEAAAEHIQKRDAAKAELIQLNVLSQIAGAPNAAVETVLFNLLENPTEYKDEVVRALTQLEAQLKGQSSKDFVKEVREAIEAMEVLGNAWGLLALIGPQYKGKHHFSKK